MSCVEEILPFAAYGFFLALVRVRHLVFVFYIVVNASWSLGNILNRKGKVRDIHLLHLKGQIGGKHCPWKF